MNQYQHKNSKQYLISELPEHERPRERLLEKGAEALSEVELIAIILRTGPRGKSTLDLARDLLYHFNSNLTNLAAASPAALSQIKGIGKAKAAELKATFALASRLAANILKENKKISTPEDAVKYFREIFRGKNQEELRVLLLNTKNIVLREELVTIGLLDRSQAHAREVFRSAIQYSAAKIILAHNHPSGDPQPSEHDIECTKNLVTSGNIIGIEIVDHIIFGMRCQEHSKDFFSFREHHLI
jgi:DNA repair protein RadC